VFLSRLQPSALHQLFHTLKDNVRCVVLNACYSTQQAAAIAEVIDCVVGMSSGVSDEAAIEFSTAFYRALGHGRNVETAFALGVGQLKLIGQTEHDVPQLLSLRNLASQLTFV
jgi:CHAT domain-containing protein